MSTKKINFLNKNGQQLAARLELPTNQEAHSFALFAHCFTCNKNLTAVRNIGRALNNEGIAVLRFDFTGLGESEGDFENTNFSSNVQDLIAASEYLTQHYKAPTLLIGHSLGGAAVLFASQQIKSVRAIATIGAPASPDHIQHLFKSSLAEINETGIAEVAIGGRPFTIKKEFLEDIAAKNMKKIIKKLRIPLLVIHSPQDATVEIQNAKKIYHYAHHPKSFISIDGADHLMSNKKDSTYVGSIIAGWASRYLNIPEKKTLTSKHQVAVSIGNEEYTTEIVAGKHFLLADEPESLGGKDFGPSPFELVSSGLGACTAITLRMYANRKEWDLKQVDVHVNHSKVNGENDQGKIDLFEREIALHGALTTEQKERLLAIADKCPVHKTLSSTSTIKTKLIG